MGCRKLSKTAIYDGDASPYHALARNPPTRTMRYGRAGTGVLPLLRPLAEMPIFFDNCSYEDVDELVDGQGFGADLGVEAGLPESVF